MRRSAEPLPLFLHTRVNSSPTGRTCQKAADLCSPELHERLAYYVIHSLHKYDLHAFRDLLRDLCISGRFLSGTRTFFICAILAANVFSFKPPIAVPASQCDLTGHGNACANLLSGHRGEHGCCIVMPADGPSFGTAPSGICKCRSCSLKYLLSTPYRSATERT